GFKYQAVARNSDGEPMNNHIVGVRISLLEGSPSGISLYTETHSLTTNEFGLFTITIGDGSTTGDFSSVNWSGGNIWLQVELDTNGGSDYQLMGSSQLLSVPYAMYAQNASNGSSQWTSGGTGIYYNTGNVGVGTTSPSPSAAMDIVSSTRGFLPPRLSSNERDAISDPEEGLVIYNTTTGCLNFFKSDGWREVCGACIVPPAPQAGFDVPVCDGDTLFLYASTVPGAGYSWSGPGGFTSSDQNPYLSGVSSASSGAYIVSAFNSCGYSPADTVTITVTPMPSTADAGPDQVDISGTSTTLEGNTPAEGSGLWTIISGMEGILADSVNPTSSFTGTSGTSYILRWTISNECAASWDEVTVSFEGIIFVCGDTVTDIRDGKLYPTVQLGPQCWMTKNMDIGEMINGALNQTDNGVIEKYCYNNLTSNCDTYGALYQWDEMMDYETAESVQGICPEEWHVPGDDEIIILEMTLGMDSATAALNNTWRGTDQGTQLLPGGSSGMDFPLGGRRIDGGSFSIIDSYAYFYASTEYGSNAYRRCLRTTSIDVGRWNTFPKSYGLSVRCLKD
ncbi:MAG: hypothetical protein KJ607_12635, partial [Bacteroidetes bacterium]|nr:hypothetical protein [Bacteroidota bacterium]